MPISKQSEWCKAGVDFLSSLFQQNINAVATITTMDADGNVDGLLDVLTNTRDHLNNIITNIQKEIENNKFRKV